MRKNRFSLCLVIAVLLFVILSLPSCISPKSVTYFNNLSDSQRVSLNSITPPQPLIQVNDELEIQIGGESQLTVQYINAYLGSSSQNAAPGISATVDVDGNIELPKIGKLRVKGFSRDEVKDLIARAYSEYLQNPIVSVKFQNFRFSILGEVKSPGYFNVPNETINIFEAMALAGDMTEYARRNNVKLIRDSNGMREIVTLDFNDKNILNSPYYYLKRYDVLYVETFNVKTTSDNISRTLPYVATVVSFIALFYTIFRK